MANKTKLEQLDVQKITNNSSGTGVLFENGLKVPHSTTIWTGHAGIMEDESDQLVANARNYGVIATSEAENTFNQPNTFNRSVLLPNSPTTPDTATITDSYITRETANNEHTVVDNSETLVNKIEGDTVKSTNILSLASSKSNGGVTVTVIDNNTLRFQGKPSSNWVRYFNEDITAILEDGQVYSAWQSHVYASTSPQVNYFYMAIVGVKADGTEVNLAIPSTVSSKFTVDKTTYKTIRCQIMSGKAYADEVDITCSFMLNKGTSVAPFSPYFNGLKHANIKQIKSTGKNLISLPYFDGTKKTHYGVTWTVNSDGSITANGTATGGNSAYFVVRYTQKMKYEPNKYYWFKASPLGGSDTTYRAYLSMADDKGAWKNDAGNDLGDGSWWNKDTGWNINLQLTIVEGFTANNLVFKPIIGYGKEIGEFEPYTENLYNLPSTIELKKWDYIKPQTGELVVGTHQIVLTGDEKLWTDSQTATSGKYRWALISKHNNYPLGIKEYGIASGGYDTVTAVDTWYNKKGVHFNGDEFSFYDPDYADSEENWRNHLRALYQAGTPIIVEIKVETPTITKLENIPKSYTVYDGGSETIIQGNEDNSIYGAIPTIEQTYAIHEQPLEAANKAYVNNGLAKKLDKTGGTITGNLIVEGKTDTELGAIVSRHRNTTYGLAYDGDSYKLGEGTLNSENGEFTFNKNEGLPIALRDDSSKFTDGELLQWSSGGNKLISSGITLSGIQSQIIGKTEYKGTVSSVAELETEITKHRADTTNPLIAGDYYIASAEFTVYEGAVPPYYTPGFEEKVHPNDIIIYNGKYEDGQGIGNESYLGWYYDYKLDIIHSDDTNNFVTKNTEQTITSKKIFDYTPPSDYAVRSRVIVGGDNFGISIYGNATGGDIGSSFDPITKISSSDISMTYYDGARAGTKFTPQNIVYTKTNPDTYTTEDHTISFPAKSGTIALTTDIEELIKDYIKMSVNDDGILTITGNILDGLNLG